jgi:hypothetical protein
MSTSPESDETGELDKLAACEADPPPPGWPADPDALPLPPPIVWNSVVL